MTPAEKKPNKEEKSGAEVKRLGGQGGKVHDEGETRFH